MYEQTLLQESSYHSQAERVEIAEAEGSPLNELDFVINTFYQTTGCAALKVIDNLIQPTA
jgi:hypothetical protein